MSIINSLFTLLSFLFWLNQRVSCVFGASSSPNIIFLLFDDLGYGDLSSRGAEYDTPNLDYLYSNGIDLTHHYTGVLCSTSRSQILTGRYAWNMGISDLLAFGQASISAPPAGLPTIANLLSQYGGYSTYALGKWHVGYSAEEHTPLNRGFDEFYGFLNSGISYVDKTVSMEAYDYEPYIDWRANRKVDYDTQDIFSTYVHGDKLKYIIKKHSSASASTSSSLTSNSDNYNNINHLNPDHDTKLRSGSSTTTTPFYVYAAFQTMHGPLETLDSDEYEGVEICDDITDKSRQKYCQNLVVVDNVLGEVILQLKKHNIWDNTLIVVTSDNGGEFIVGGCNYPLRGGKNDFFEGGIRTISFVTGGYIDSEQAGTERDEYIHGVDWTPTLLSIAGLDVNEIEQDLQDNLYIPLAKSVSSKVDDNEDNYKDYLMDVSLDGMDMSEWILKGSIKGDNVDTNIRTNIPLSINKDLVEQLEDMLEIEMHPGIPDNHSTAIIFDSKYTGNTYKVMNLYDTPSSYDLCTFTGDDGTAEDSSSSDDMSDNLKWLLDLTLDTTESTNLIDYLDDESSLIDESLIDLDSIPKVTDPDTGEISYEYNIKKIKDYKDNDDLIALLWHEANAVINEYMDNNMYNTFLDCTRGSYTTEADPSQFDDAWSPFYSWLEYRQQIRSQCSEYSNDALLTLYTTRYKDYVSASEESTLQSKSNGKTREEKERQNDNNEQLHVAKNEKEGKRFSEAVTRTELFVKTFSIVAAVVVFAVLTCLIGIRCGQGNGKLKGDYIEYTRIGP